MSIVLALCSVLLIVLVLLDGFEAMLLPRRMTRAFRFARLFYRYTWMPWSAVGRRMPPGRRRENFLSLYGPLSIILLFAAWAVGLIVGFAELHQALGTPLTHAWRPPRPARLSLHERDDLLHARLRRRHARRQVRPDARGRRGGDRLRVPRGR